jgi:hypothetical protein
MPKPQFPVNPIPGNRAFLLTAQSLRDISQTTIYT